VAGFYWLAGVKNGSAHFFAPSSAPFVCITKLGRFSKPGSSRIFLEGTCYHRLLYPERGFNLEPDPM
jgi:hypothetical protein